MDSGGNWKQLDSAKERVLQPKLIFFSFLQNPSFRGPQNFYCWNPHFHGVDVRLFLQKSLSKICAVSNPKRKQNSGSLLIVDLTAKPQFGGIILLKMDEPLTRKNSSISGTELSAWGNGRTSNDCAKFLLSWKSVSTLTSKDFFSISIFRCWKCGLWMYF